LIGKLLALVRRVVGPDSCRTDKSSAVAGLYETREYLEAYSRHTDIRVTEDPKEAVGGLWEEVGRLQFDFLRHVGMQPGHRLLDVGCGTLRGGRHAIRYLEPGHYAGMDISPKAIEAAWRLVEEEGLSEKRPRLIVSERKDLKFAEFEGETFDYIMAQSVFTHLMPEHINECLEHVSQLMQENTKFCFTFNVADEYVQTGHKGFRYPYSFFENLASKYGYIIENRSDEYPHPRGQKLAIITKVP